MHEIAKEFNDLALMAAKALVSEETKLIHYFKGDKEPPYQAAPIKENLLYALALLRKKEMESILEGRKLLDKLLHYQHENGLFPNYLHDFPDCYDKFIGAHLLPIFHLIQHHFHSVLGQELELKLKVVVGKLLNASEKELSQMPLPLKVVVETLLEKEITPWTEWKLSPHLYKPESLGLICLAMLQLKSAKRPAWWNEASSFIRTLWHPTLKVYSGPYVDTSFVHGEPEITLFDLAMSLADQQIAPRLRNEGTLQAALFFSEDSLFANDTKQNMKNPHAAPLLGTLEKGSYPLVFSFGEGELRTLLCEIKNGKTVHFNEKEGFLEMQFQLSETIPSEEKEESREVILYFPLKPDVKHSVNGVSATTFRLGDQVILEDHHFIFQIAFRSDSNAIYQGHIARSKRSTERMKAGKNRFTATDWQIALRTIFREPQETLFLTVKYAKKNC